MAQFKDNILPKNKQTKTPLLNKGKQIYPSSNKLFCFIIQKNACLSKLWTLFFTIFLFFMHKINRPLLCPTKTLYGMEDMGPKYPNTSALGTGLRISFQVSFFYL